MVENMKKVTIHISDCPYKYVQAGFHHKIYDREGKELNFLDRKSAINWIDAWRELFGVSGKKSQFS